MVGIAWRGFEVKSFIEPLRFVILCMNAKSADPCNFRSLKSAQHCIFQESGSKSLALPRDGNREPGQQHDRHRITREPFGQTLRSIVVFNLPHYECVVTNNQMISKGQIGLRSTGLLVLQCKAGEKSIERLASTVECFNNVLPVELFNPK